MQYVFHIHDTLVIRDIHDKRDTQPITYISEPSKTQIDYIMVRNKDRVRDVKVIAEEEAWPVTAQK